MGVGSKGAAGGEDEAGRRRSGVVAGMEEDARTRVYDAGLRLGGVEGGPGNPAGGQIDLAGGPTGQGAGRGWVGQLRNGAAHAPIAGPSRGRPIWGRPSQRDGEGAARVSPPAASAAAAGTGVRDGVGVGRGCRGARRGE
nr:spidroin-1-like [Aegilops tauschii subsp. strangulata]